ncbi:MAG TPA: SDR family NAD(P)-dependent oxidoreductase, partial [Burkholderiales bacterium]|nr:SDR family NAD(P)-dependent oxidoreductase [Burkholderiales bacterium]
MPTVLITGAGRGLGLELVRQCAADGWNVLGTVRNEVSRKALQALGARAFLLDVTDFNAVRKLGEQLRGEAIDVLICN